MRLDLRKQDNGYSTCKVFENNEVEISLGKENTYKHNEPIANITFKPLNLEVIGDEKLHKVCKAFVDGKGEDLFFYDKVMKVLDLQYTDLIGLTMKHYKKGFEEGQRDLREKLNNLLRGEVT